MIDQPQPADDPPIYSKREMASQIDDAVNEMLDCEDICISRRRLDYLVLSKIAQLVTAFSNTFGDMDKSELQSTCDVAAKSARVILKRLSKDH